MSLPKRTLLSPQFQSLSMMLSEGQMVPVRISPNVPAVSLLVRMRESDLDFFMTRQPPVTVLPGLVIHRQYQVRRPMVYFLLRVDDKPRLTYQLQFNMFQQDQLKDLQALCKQKGLVVILSDGTTCISFKVFPPYHRHLCMLVHTARVQANTRVSPTECLQLSQMIERKSGGPEKLWSLFAKHRCLIQISQTQTAAS